MKKLFNTHKVSMLGVFLGGLGGYLYWYYIGCSSGTCAITSSSVNSSLYGALMGFLLIGMIPKPKQSTEKEHK